MKIKQGYDSGKLAYGVFLGFQRVFDTVNHDTFFKKLAIKLGSITINKAGSSDKPISSGVPRGSILGPILFIFFINEFHKPAEFSTVNHFAEDTNLLLTENSLKKLNKHINRDLKLVVQWIRANKSLKTGKPKIFI